MPAVAICLNVMTGLKPSARAATKTKIEDECMARDKEILLAGSGPKIE